MNAYLAFAETLTELRRASRERWQLDRDGQTDHADPARENHHRAQTAAQYALLRVRLLTCGQTEIVDAAHAALHAASHIVHATDPARLDQASALATDATDAFVARAADLLS
jgi:hypothetical protein